MSLLKQIEARLVGVDLLNLLSEKERIRLHGELVHQLSILACEPGLLYSYDIAKKLLDLERVARSIGLQHIHPIERIQYGRICSVTGLEEVERATAFFWEFLDTGNTWRRFDAYQTESRVEMALYNAQVKIRNGEFDFDPQNQLWGFISGEI